MCEIFIYCVFTLTHPTHVEDHLQEHIQPKWENRNIYFKIEQEKYIGIGDEEPDGGEKAEMQRAAGRRPAGPHRPPSPSPARAPGQLPF